jgi:hypothetical protein
MRASIHKVNPVFGVTNPSGNSRLKATGGLKVIWGSELSIPAPRSIRRMAAES